MKKLKFKIIYLVGKDVSGRKRFQPLTFKAIGGGGGLETARKV